MATQESKVLILNAAHTAALTERTRTTSRGTSQRFTIDIVQEGIGVNLDEISAGRGIANALVEAIKKRIQERAGQASDGTIAFRVAAQTALMKGKAWAQARYNPPGNRMGPREPGKTQQKFQDSGRLVEGMVSTPTRDGTFTINTAKGRFDPNTWKAGKNAPTFETVFRELLEMIDIATIADVPIVRAAIEVSTAKMVQKLGKGALQLGKALRELGQTLGDTGEALDDFTGG